MTVLKVSSIHHLQISHNTPYLPSKILHNLCFSFLLAITFVPRETENNNYAPFLLGWGGGGGGGKYKFQVRMGP